MRCSRVLFALVCVYVFATPVFASPKAGAAKASSRVDADYHSALATADRFLQAWQTGDAEAGMVLLTTRAKEKATSNVLDGYFSTPDGNAYEINHGKQLRAGRYEFPIVMLTSGVPNRHPRRRFSSVVVARTGNNDWAVDKLP